MTEFFSLNFSLKIRKAVQSTLILFPLLGITNLLFFSSEVVGTDGARQQLRHEQNRDMLRFGGIGGFLTANVADRHREQPQTEMINSEISTTITVIDIIRMTMAMIRNCKRAPRSL